jgi:phosphate transport system permease protein
VHFFQGGKKLMFSAMSAITVPVSSKSTWATNACSPSAEGIGESQVTTVIPASRAYLVRLSLDVLWGVPSIVYGAFGFTLMIFLGLRASLLGGIIALALLELPIMVRAVDEVMTMVPLELKEASYSLGATRLETAVKVMVRQTLPGLLTALLLGFGRGIGDAASVLFTAGYTDRLPTSFLRPVASLPLAVFFQLGTPVPEVRERAYASALVLTALILAISLTARLLTRRLARHVIR